MSFMPTLPADWQVRRLKYVATCNDDVLPESTDEFEELRYVEISGVSLVGGIESTTDVYFHAAPSRARRRVNSGDILISTVRTYLKAIAAVPHAEPNLIASTGFCVVRPGSGVDSGYLGWVAKSEPFVAAIVARSAGVSYPAIKPSELTTLNVPLPPLEIQLRIARFLDAKTARIDALIAKKRALLERLAEKRQALITQAVTKGLDPNVPTKDSGIDWLGRIPAHWGMKRLRFVVRLASGATPSTTTPEYWEGDIPWISPKDVKRDLLRDSQDHVTHIAIDECGLRLFSQPDVVLVVRGMILARYVPIAVATGTYTINQDIKVLESKGEVEPAYLQMYLASINSYLMTLVAEAGHGTKALRTDVLLLPSVDEQRRIVASMDDAKRYFDDAMTKLADSASTLVEYRAALITAAVTGQLEVPADAQHNRPDERLGKLAAEVA